MSTDLQEPVWASVAERRRLVRLCTSITGDAVAAEDLAQESLVTAWRLRHRLVDPSGASAWLDAIARNVCHRHRVRQARRARHERADGPGDARGMDDATADPLVDLLERHELVALLDRALALLPAETRGALVARYVEELTPGEIATRTGVSPDAVSMRLLRGRTKLRHLLEDDLADDPAARVWTGRHGTAWRATRLCCPICAVPGLEHRRDRPRRVVELRCPACGPEVSSAYRLDNPTLGPLLADVSRPGAVVARMAAWAAEYWAGDGTRPAACTGCGHAVAPASYRRTGTVEPRSSRGWQLSCPSCGEEQTASLDAVALLQPQTRALRERHPGVRAVPSRQETRDGRDVEIVGFRDPRSGRGVDVHFSAGPDARLLAVVTG